MGIRRPPEKNSPWPTNLVCGAAFTIYALDTNVIHVGVQLKDQNGDNLADNVVGHVGWHIANGKSGVDMIATALTGGVSAGADGGIVSVLAGKHGWAVSELGGHIDFNLTDSGNPTVYLAIRLPNGGLVVSQALRFLEGGTGT